MLQSKPRITFFTLGVLKAPVGDPGRPRLAALKLSIRPIGRAKDRAPLDSAFGLP